MGINGRVSRTFTVLAGLFFCIAAAEFPVFRMEEFEQRADPFKVDIPDKVNVEPVSKRIYGSEEQKRLPVAGVEIEEVVPYPELGISQETVQALINRRFEEERSIELDDNSFTQRDLQDIGRFLRDIIDRGGYDEEDLEEIVKMVRTQEVKRGWITIEQLDSIALSVTEFYREKGLILATAFVPEQTVSDGLIRLKVLEGRLGNITVSNNSIFDESVISAAFNGEMGEAVTEERIESALRRINDLPGVRVRGSFSPGQNVGETSLNLGVLDEKAWSSNVLMDNHGSDTTGEIRLFATTEWLNIRQKGHRLLIGALRSEGPDSSLYGLAEYELPVTEDGRGKVRATISTNTFSVGATQALPEIVGETDNYGVLGAYQFVRSRTLNINTQVGYTYKDVRFQVGDLASLSTDQQIETFSVAAEYTRLWDDQQLLLSGRLGIDQGHVIQGEVQDQSTDFTKTILNLNILKRFSVYNWLTKEDSFFNFVFKVNSQFAPKFLSSVEQFSMGGPSAVRAFSVSDISVDSGAYVGMELFFDLPIDPIARFNLPFEPIKPFLFFDYAYGVSRRPGGGQDLDAQIKGYGLGMRATWPGRGNLNLIFAKPRSTSFDDNFSIAEGESRVYFDLLYQVR
ncbi:MAG: hemolysin activation/secretion protein [Candidatus Azotimanducaceae bacterium]|jgi:hemolysin activation/secretion protein